MYVQKHFKEEAKHAMDEMVRDIRAEFDRIVDELDWMDPSTKIRAKVKRDPSPPPPSSSGPMTYESLD